MELVDLLGGADKILTDAQKRMLAVMDENDYSLFYGGARSGKTLMVVMSLIQRARVPKTSHLMARQRLVMAREALVEGTFPIAFELLRMREGVDYEYNGLLHRYKLKGGGEIWIKGIGDKERAGRFGTEYSTVVLDEVSEISFDSKEKLETRLVERGGQRGKMVFILNPTFKTHWTYKLFFRNENPIDRGKLSDQLSYGKLQVNPRDNPHLDKRFFDRLGSQSREQRVRFLEGEYQDYTVSAVFPSSFRYCSPQPLASMDSIVIGIDPAGSGRRESDLTGMVLAARGEGNLYVLRDYSARFSSPTEWSRLAIRLQQETGALIVIENNYGGDMVKSAIEHIDASARVDLVFHKKSKLERAFVASALYNEERVFHIVNNDADKDRFMYLEDELHNFTNSGWMGLDSPDRADALFIAIRRLFDLPEGVHSFLVAGGSEFISNRERVLNV